MAPEVPAKTAARQAWIRALDAIKILEQEPGPTLPGLLDGLAAQYGDRPALLDEAGCLSYRALAHRANRVARWADAQGLAPGQAVRGQVVGLLMPNCADYVALWLGLTRAGCTVALINTHLKAEGLAHSLRICGARCLIVDRSLVPAGAWPNGVQIVEWPALIADLDAYADAAIPTADLALPGLRDRALLIYTSGTTGWPKAANVTHARIMEWSFWFAGMMNAQPDDRLYDCLPMYHSVGGIVAVGAMLVKGGSVLIRRRFSASRLWDDVVDGDCTIFQYIGELCRYLTASPPHPKERAHQLRLACGNGLAGDVWGTFQNRFALPRILEFYAATEGSVSLYNCEGKQGAIGRVPAFLSHRFPIALIRCEPQTGTPTRDAAGHCMPCDLDEPGEAIGLIAPGRPFDGYTDADASDRKILTDVFTPGDRWFRTGDLMRKDAAGYYYFVDRIGDTYRWKGENVATTEVAAVLRACPGVTDAAVYGVPVPGHEGRAGMAAISTDPRFDLGVLRAHLVSSLPDYAQPLFLRICPTLEMTGTFKLTKATLAAESFTDATDPVWFNDRHSAAFIPLDQAQARGFTRVIPVRVDINPPAATPTPTLHTRLREKRGSS